MMLVYTVYMIHFWMTIPNVLCFFFFCLFLHVFVCECVSVSMCFLLIILSPPLLYKINGSVQHAVLPGLLISDTVFPILPLTHTHTSMHRLLWSFTHFYTILRFLQCMIFGTVIIRIYKRAHFSTHPSFSLSSSLSVHLRRSHWLC